MESKTKACAIENGVGQIEIIDNSARLDYLSNCPPDVIQLMLSQDCLSGYDVHSVSLVSHYFGKLFFLYALKPDHERYLPGKPRYLQETSSFGLFQLIANMLSPDNVWTAQEKFEKFPFQCLKDELLPFSPGCLDKQLPGTGCFGTDKILVKDALASKKYTLADLKNKEQIIKDKKKRYNLMDYELVGLPHAFIEYGQRDEYARACMLDPKIQLAVVRKEMTAQNLVNYDTYTAFALLLWTRCSPQMLSFEQVAQSPQQACLFFQNECIREMIFKEGLKSIESGQKMKSELLELSVWSIEFLLLSVPRPYAYRESRSELSDRQDLGRELRSRLLNPVNIGNDTHAHVSSHSNNIWVNKLQPIVEMIEGKLIEVDDLLRMSMKDMLSLLDESTCSAFKIKRQNARSIRPKEECAIQ